jgi:SGNH hydrolase-like domain, acetyltransferase AlgX
MKAIRNILMFMVATIVLLEVALRVVAIFPNDSATFVNDENIGIRMRPNVPIGDGNKTNSSGFNDIEHSIDRKAKGGRLAIIGDSFVFGVVPRGDNFTQMLQKQLSLGRDDAEVINMGIPAAGPRNYHGLLKNDAVWFKVDTVYVMFFIGNDIVQSHPDFKTIILFGSAREVLARAYLVGLDKEYSYVYKTVRAGARLIYERYLPEKEEGATFSRSTYFSIEKQRSIVFENDMSRYVEDSYIESIRLLSELSETAISQGMSFRVILAPDEIQVDKQLRVAVSSAYGMEQDKYDFRQPQRIISEKLSEKGISFIDLLPAFEEAGKTRILYKKYDSHWNEAGNKLAADIIANVEMNR